MQMAAFRRAFNGFDTDGSGSIDANKLSAAISSLGQKLPSETVLELISAADCDGNDKIDFEEYVIMMKAYQSQTSKSDVPINEQRKLNLDNLVKAFLMYRRVEGTNVNKTSDPEKQTKDKNKRQGLKLRQHKKVLFFLEQCWTKLTTQKGRDFIAKEDYISYMTNVCKVLWDEADYTDVKACAAAGEEWEREMGPQAQCWFEKEIFFDSLFQLIDIWAASTHVEEYLFYLKALSDRVWYSSKKWPEKARDEIRAPEHVSSLQKQTHNEDPDDEDAVPIFDLFWNPQPISVVVSSGGTPSLKELSSLDASEFESSKQTEILPNEIESDDAEPPSANIIDGPMTPIQTMSTVKPAEENVRRSGKVEIRQLRISPMKISAPKSFVPYVGAAESPYSRVSKDATTKRHNDRVGARAALAKQTDSIAILIKDKGRQTDPQQQQKKRQQARRKKREHEVLHEDRRFFFGPPSRTERVKSVIWGAPLNLAPRKEAVTCGISGGGNPFAGVAAFPTSYAPWREVKSRLQVQREHEQQVRKDRGGESLATRTPVSPGLNIMVPDLRCIETSGEHLNVEPQQDTNVQTTNSILSLGSSQPRRPLHQPKYPRKYSQQRHAYIASDEEKLGGTESIIKGAQKQQNNRDKKGPKIVTFHVAERRPGRSLAVNSWYEYPPTQKTYVHDVRPVGSYHWPISEGAGGLNAIGLSVARGSGGISSASQAGLLPTPPHPCSRETAKALYGLLETGPGVQIDQENMTAFLIQEAEAMASVPVRSDETGAESDRWWNGDNSHLQLVLSPLI